ncbi:MAG: c-type cytochrome [Chitinophagaceae bacterium]
MTDQEGPSPVLTPAEELLTFKLSPGLKIQLVAAEPLVQDPVVLTFDADGRLWVVEMRGFMPDIDGKGEKERVGRISVLEDINSDGQMDKSTIYMDSLVMPRALALVPGGALVAENEALWLTEDLDGDLRADKKTLLDAAYAGGPSPEHSGNGLCRNIDNWYYNARSRFRYQLRNGKWRRDSTEFRGQWGISHDNKGRLYYNYNWSQLHADLVPPNYLSRNKNHTYTTGIDEGLTLDRRIYPIRPNPAVNRGYIPGTLDKEGRLLEFTAACSPLLYRGTALPAEYHGNVFVCEPAGNLVKRNIIQESGLHLKANDPKPGTEFLASEDERFRPVHLASGPDGALYIADMYRGLVQHGTYVTPYLREQTIKRKLVQPINCGRIWRIVPENWTPRPQKKLSKATSQDLISSLSHQDGWYRDMAQQLLVERGDKDMGKLLIDLAQSGDNELGRLHALWTLEGLQLPAPDLLFQLLRDRSPIISSTAVRMLEPIAAGNLNLRVKLEQELLKIWETAPTEQILQMTLASRLLDQQVSHQLLAGVAERYDTSALIRDALLSSLQDQEFLFLEKLWNAPAFQKQSQSKEILLEMLATSILRQGDAAALSSLFTMLDEKGSFGWKEKAVVTGIAIQGKNAQLKPVRLASAPRMLTRTDLAAEHARINVLMTMFEWPGHVISNRLAQTKNALEQNDQKRFVAGRQLYLNTCAGCHGSDGAGVKRLAPPLIGSDWVLGNEKRLVLVILHGMEGPVKVNGKRYDIPEILPVMPAHSTLDDNAISSILTYIRNEWTNNAGAVSGRMVSTTRHTSQGKVVPWTADELNRHIKEVEK